MTGTYDGHIHNFKISEKSPRGVIDFHVVALPSGPGDLAPGDFPKLKLDEDSDQSFTGMAAICGRMAGVGSGGTINVRIEVLSGAKDEIDTIEIVT